ncbi:MAG: murein L,D-transpeptidase [Alphaproteobacteria bacterium]|nr:MAG: murein L,D-transpeptidase [Alphaproteobacteria bacterium]
MRAPRAFALALLATASLTLGPAHEAPAAPPAGLAPLDVGPEIAAFYRDRGFAPFWVTREGLKPEARRLLGMIAPNAALQTAIAAAADGDPHRLTRVDLLLSRAYADFARDRLRGPAGNAMRYIDPEVAPGSPSDRELLDGAAGAASLDRQLTVLERVNPAFQGLVRGLAAYRARWSRLPQISLPPRANEAMLRQRLGLTPTAALAPALREFQHVHGLPQTGTPDPATIAALNRGALHYEQLILANIERARAIPARTGRSILVDTASARLWMIEDGRIVDAMRVVVGKRAMPTPLMAGTIRYAVQNPYWNLPPDLIRKRAGNAARRGPGVITGERLQVLSDWSPGARVLDPRRVNWAAVAAGRQLVNVRQLPGPHNMMGRIKFMMPNDLGVYLHDTPLRHLLAQADRHESSGCVRLQDAQRLARWLFNGNVPVPSGAAEQDVDLPEPVPVYLAYFTALPSRDGIVFQRDVYGRDHS